jgi:hypothetical protein
MEWLVTLWPEMTWSARIGEERAGLKGGTEMQDSL